MGKLNIYQAKNLSTLSIWTLPLGNNIIDNYKNILGNKEKGDVRKHTFEIINILRHLDTETF